ncbi:MAG: beta-hydroxyacyl-ACP dehydratase [Leptonema illini]|jgi:3-hydroxyacyl-[acyl-carrier-protein] dehydratase|uniref:Beta-hydroxyacyl-(Acyl-carrier-protein) dehydratase FabA/FabZ n=2 Tax=Leptonema illini TaxID=183 RepID=H2CG55_9LEPT|nr:3-hydroxyacyl-ACP dehydratase FabZ family protein [Leptonema illini]EHQ05736.1 Beta-hydroxyacyl-(acyl-carrier-protein) dehydratase FabA/FabZ [Leptonema illini DSM 21528]KAB2934037.1 MAG: beta-hydroxyacyl-ACP dehydratase [Leptonema illini]PKL34217.1 MAG: beta-hydroxyacyl-ACP dehydratase [Spirochaetae bacterium HGW-Spirochaetae-10]
MAAELVTDPAIIEKVLQTVPQRPPFRYIDRILELSEDHIVGQYTYSKDEFFYPGHFPGHPVTPGVILLETMAQTGVVALGIYNAIKNGGSLNQISLFTDAEVEFAAMVLPGDTVTIKSQKIFLRRGKIRSKVDIYKQDGTLAASGTLSGMGVAL